MVAHWFPAGIYDTKYLAKKCLGELYLATSLQKLYDALVTGLGQGGQGQADVQEVYRWAAGSAGPLWLLAVLGPCGCWQCWAPVAAGSAGHLWLLAVLGTCGCAAELGACMPCYGHTACCHQHSSRLY
jgi:hypothetical protein